MKPTIETPSHLFYQSRLRRPVLERAAGVYLWDVDGKRYLDGSSGAMVCNIGHSNPRVLEAMRRQMEKSTFGYRLHFETEPAEKLAARVAALMPPRINRLFFVSGGSEDTPERWKALNHSVAVNKLLGHENRVAMANRKGHAPTTESNEQIYAFFEFFLRRAE